MKLTILVLSLGVTAGSHGDYTCTDRQTQAAITNRSARPAETKLNV